MPPIGVNKTEKVPSKAFYFTEEDQRVSFSAADGEGKKKNLTITPLYSGGPVRHWWFGDVIIDLESTSFRGRKFPVLRDHDTDRILGFSGRPEIVADDTGKKSIHLTNVTLVDTEDTQKVVQLGDEGFPFQASISIRPTKIQRLEEGEEAQVNGFTVKGPIAIWRNNIYKEGSVCVFGVDSNTATTVFSEQEVAEMPKVDFSYIEEGNEHQPKPEEKAMPFDPSQFKDDPAFAAFVDATKKEVTDTAAAEVAGLKADLAEKDKTIGELSASKTELSGRLDTVEKTMAKFAAQAQEKDLVAASSAIVSKMMAEAEFSDYQEGKVTPVLPHYSQFVKEGVLDEAGFSAAVKKDIDEWKAVFSKSGSSEGRVQGAGSAPAVFAGQSGGTDKANFFDPEAQAKRMAAFMGYEEPASKDNSAA